MGLREYKFRAWYEGIDEEFMSEVLDMDFKHKEAYIKPAPCDAMIGFRDLIFMQYVGLNDRNNNEIYEDDIVEAINWCGQKIIGTITFELGSVKCGGVSMQRLTKSPIVKGIVIGNIYENEELLNE